MRPLCGSVQVFPDESLLSVVVRTSDANVVPRTSGLLSHAGLQNVVVASLPFTYLESAGPIASLLGMTDFEVQRRMFPRHQKATSTEIDWFGTRLERRFVEARQRRFSSIGLSNRPYARSSWMIRALTHCPETFELLRSDCPSCGKVLGWARAVGINRCERCDAKLDQTSTILPKVIQASYRRIADVVSVSPADRRNSISSLAAPFDAWEPGDVFAALVNLGAAAANASAEQADFAHPLSMGNFSSLGSNGLFLGWQILSDWPFTFDRLVKSILDERRQSRSLFESLGPLGMFFRPTSKAKGRDLVKDRVSQAFRDVEIPFRRIRKSAALHMSRKTTISLIEAVTEHGLSHHVLKRLKTGDGYALDRTRTLHLFDKQRLEKSVSLMRSGLSIKQAAYSLGAPAHSVPALAAAGLLEEITDPGVVAMAQKTLINPTSLAHLEAKLGKISRSKIMNNAVRLSVALRDDLSPTAWATAFDAILAGTLSAVLVEDGQYFWANKLWVPESALTKALRKARAAPLPAVEIAMSVAAPIIGMNQVTLAKIVDAGMLHRSPKGIALQALSDFREVYVGPSEIGRCYNLSGQQFANMMICAGAQPVGKFHQANLWLRADVELVFGSQAK